MFCRNCGKESDSTKKFCINCGNAFSVVANQQNQSQFTSLSFTKTTKKINTSKVIRIIVVVVVIGWIAYSNLDKGSIQTNNEGISSFDSGNSDQAIQQLKEASNSAVTDDTKINTLKNLGYVYASEGQANLALNSFKEALSLANSDSFDYYLISGEIALLEEKPNLAQVSYNKAYKLRPNDFQINNALNLFYLDLDEVAPDYVDYQKALKHAQKAYDVSEKLVRNTATQNLGIAYFFNDNFDQAISFLSKSDINNEPYIALWIGLSYAGKEDVVNAKRYFTMAINKGVTVPQYVEDYMNDN